LTLLVVGGARPMTTRPAHKKKRAPNAAEKIF